MKIHLTGILQDAMLKAATLTDINNYYEAILMNTLTGNTDFHDIHFDSIQTLRGIAALFVLIEHIRFLACGAFGVDIFFCISGFIIMLTTHKHTAYFLRKRLLRIVPFYYLMTIGTFGLLLLFPSMFEQTQADLSYLIRSLLFLPFDMGGGTLQPLLRIGWTVNCEIFFYLLFALALRLSHKYRGLICSLLLVLCVLTGALLSGGNTWTGDSLTDAGGNISALLAPIYFFANPIMLEFILGILCYYAARAGYTLVQKLPDRTVRLISTVALLTAVVLLLGLLLTYSSVNVLGYRRLLYRGLPALLILVCFLLCGFGLSMPAPCVKLGNISFSIYLIHYYPIMLMDRKIFDFSSLTLRSVIGALLGSVIVIALAAAAWYIIEQKLTGWLRRKLFSSTSQNK